VTEADQKRLTREVTVDLDELKEPWRAEAQAELDAFLTEQARYDKFQGLAAIVLAG
jgi:hypothetical protein